MTSEQAAWLRAHPHYRPRGQADANSAFRGSGASAPSTGRGVLHPDGRFELLKRGQALPLPGHNEAAAFVVGIPPQAGSQPGVPDPRGNPNERGYDRKA